MNYVLSRKYNSLQSKETLMRTPLNRNIKEYFLNLIQSTFIIKCYISLHQMSFLFVALTIRSGKQIVDTYHKLHDLITSGKKKKRHKVIVQNPSVQQNELTTHMSPSPESDVVIFWRTHRDF